MQILSYFSNKFGTDIYFQSFSELVSSMHYISLSLFSSILLDNLLVYSFTYTRILGPYIIVLVHWLCFFTIVMPFFFSLLDV